MKQNKNPRAKSSIHRNKSVSKRAAIKHVVHQNRSVRKNIALHPINVLFLLCVGVLLVVFTINVLADSFTVTAVVPAPALTDPATIISPTDGTQTSTQVIDVTGTCPVGSYVNLTNNSSFVGTDVCSNSLTFDIQIDLASGANILQAQDYNITNSPGPTSGTVTVTYTPPVQPTNPPVQQNNQPAVVTPSTIQLLDVDKGIPYDATGPIPTITQNPTFTGVVPPYSKVVVNIYSNPYTCQTYANSQGYWSCTFQETITPGSHHVVVTIEPPNSKKVVLPEFPIKVSSATPNSSSGNGLPLRITSDYTYRIYNIGQVVGINILVSGGVPPMAFSISWGDGNTSTKFWGSDDELSLSHTYSWINATEKHEVIKVEAVDSAGNTSALQLGVMVRNSAYTSPVASATRFSGLWGLFSKIRPWLSIIWPGYLIIVLLVFSFWLGERQEIETIMRKRHINQLKHHGLKR
jgi:hypothetical protein